MPRLIGIVSCFKEAKHRQAIRETWAKEIPDGWVLKFFLGGSDWKPETDPDVIAFMGPPATLAVMHPTKAAAIGLVSDLQPDEVVLDVPDSYLGTAWKGKSIQKWAFENDFDGLFLGMCDTLIFPKMLQKACVGECSAQVFIAAATKAYPKKVPCPHGGFGYWLSRRALKAIYDEPVRHYSEDQSTAFALHHAGVRIMPNPIFAGNRLLGGHVMIGSVSQHLSTKHQEFKPSDIYEAWARAQNVKILQHYPGWDGVCRKCQGVKFKMGIYGPRCSGCGELRPWQ